MLADITSMISLGSVPNTAGLEEQFSKTWSVATNKLFQKGGPAMAGVSPAVAGGQSRGLPGGSVPSAMVAE